MSDSKLTPVSTIKPVMSILEAERMAGYREGVSTINQVLRDEAHEEGRITGRNEAFAERRGWGYLCFLCGIAVAIAFFGLRLA